VQDASSSVSFSDGSCAVPQDSGMWNKRFTINISFSKIFLELGNSPKIILDDFRALFLSDLL